MVGKTLNEKPTRTRWIVAFMMWAAIAINFLDRTTLAIATPHIMEEIHITTEEMGMLMSAFFLCYALLQIPAGFISDKFGQRKILGLSVFWWSIATGLTGLASGFKSFLLCRMVLGIGEAGAYPSNAAITRKWFPKSERATVGGLFDSGQKFGGAFGIPILTWLMVSVGWRETFAILGALGVIWAIVWYTFFRDNPSEHKGVNKAELDIIHDGQEAETDKTMPLKWYQLLKYRNVQAMCIGFFILNYILYFFITWFPTYLVQERGMQFGQMGIVASVPFIAAVCGSLISGIIADKLLIKGWSVTRTRKTLLVIGILLATSVGLAAFVESNAVVIGLLAVANFGCAVTGAMQWCLASDVAPKGMGSQLAGLQNCVANFGGVASPIVAGAILATTNSFQIALYTYGITALIGAIVYGCYLGKIEQISVAEKM